VYTDGGALLIKQTLRSPEAGQARGYIKLGRQALGADDPATARDYFKNALEIIEPPPEWAIREIRQALQDYVDEVEKKSTPDLDDKAQIAFDSLRDLELQNADTFTQKRKFKLRRVRSLLEGRQIDQGFKIVDGLLVEAEQPGVQRQIVTAISRIVGNYVSQCIAQQQWIEALQVVERLQTSSPPTDELNGWLAIVSQILATVHEQGQQNQDLTQAQRRGLNFARVVLVIFIAAALVYTLVYVL
jgi:hypothetical protein